MRAVDTVIEYNQLNEQVYLLLKKEILNGSLSGGERLSIGGIAQRMGVSATPVRDALRMLQADGLVTVVPRSGTFVAEFTPENVHEVFETRLILECAGIQRLLDADPAILQRLVQIVDQQRSLVSRGAELDYPRYIDLDDQLHRCFVEPLNNSLIMTFYQELHWAIQVTRGLIHSTHPGAANTVDEHAAIVRACLEGDLEDAKRLLERHLKRARKNLLRRMAAAETIDKPGRQSTGGSDSTEADPLVVAELDVRHP